MGAYGEKGELRGRRVHSGMRKRVKDKEQMSVEMRRGEEAHGERGEGRGRRSVAEDEATTTSLEV